jgi:tail tube protein
MGTKTRTLGIDATLLGITETTYGTSPTSGYKKLSFKSTDLDSERPLGTDPLLGQGRDAQDPFYNAVSVSGDVEIPFDTQNLGWYFHGLFGAETVTQVSATGSIAFSAQPAANATITLNGTVWTFVSGSPTGNQTQIGANLAATLTALATNLNASADTQVAKCTYTADTAHGKLAISYDTAGIGGNAFTLAASSSPASNATPSATTLLGGGYSHAFTSGGAVPSKTLEVGHPQLVTPRYYRFAGCVFGGLTFSMARTGAASGKINVIAQGRARAATTIDGSAAAYLLTRFSQGNGSINLGGTQLANVTGGDFTFSNSLQAVETIRADGLIDGVDAGEAIASGKVTVRQSTDTTIEDAVDAQTPVAFQYVYSHPAGWSLTFDLPRVFLPKPKAGISGPGGIQQTFDWQAAKDATAGYMLRATLVNDVASYA